MNPNNRLHKSRTDVCVAGVCGGIAEYLEFDPTVLRIVWAVASCFWGAGILVYLIAALVMPEG